MITAAYADVVVPEGVRPLFQTSSFLDLPDRIVAALGSNTAGAVQDRFRSRKPSTLWTLREFSGLKRYELKVDRDDRRSG